VSEEAGTATFSSAPLGRASARYQRAILRRSLALPRVPAVRLNGVAGDRSGAEGPQTLTMTSGSPAVLACSPCLQPQRL